MMSYYDIVIALRTQVRKKPKRAICGYDIKGEGGCKDASPFKYISTTPVRAVFDNLLRHTQEGRAEINHFYDTICYHYFRNLKPHQEPLDGCLLKRVTIYKRRATLIPHESILFTLQSEHDGGDEFHLLVERTVDFISSLGFSSKDPLLPKAKYATDTARLVDIVAGIDMVSHKSYGEPMWTLVMPPVDRGFSINLIQLLALLRALRGTNRGTQYNAIDRNCFWLVRMARLVIMRLAEQAGVQVNPDTSRQAEERLGTCGCVRLDGSRSHGSGEALVDDLIRTFEDDYRDFEQCYSDSGNQTLQEQLGGFITSISGCFR